MINGIPYFPLDVHIDDSMELIEAEFGLRGFGVIVKLYQRIYGGDGYFCRWSEDVCMVFSRRIGEDSGFVAAVAETAVRRGIFDSEQYKKHGILTSEKIQERYFSAVSRRKRVEVCEEYLLVPFSVKPETADNSEENSAKSESAAETSENADKNLKNADNFQQRKEKESKENKSKEDERKGEDEARPRGAYKNVLLTDEQYKALTDEFGRSKTDEYIERMDEYCEGSGRRYANYAAAAARWIREDMQNAGGTSRSGRESPLKNYVPETRPDFDALEERILDEMLRE